MYTQYDIDEAVCTSCHHCRGWNELLVSSTNCVLSVQEVDDATLLRKVETAIASNHSLQMLKVERIAPSIIEAVLKGACRNSSLKELYIRVFTRVQARHMAAAAAAAELRRVRPQLKFDNFL